MDERMGSGANVGAGGGQESEKGGPAEGHHADSRTSRLD